MTAGANEASAGEAVLGLVSARRIEWMIDAQARARPDHPALIFRSRCWTYAALREEIDRRAALLVMSGLRPGDVVATTELVTDDVGLSFLACCRADLTFLYLPSKESPATLAHAMGRSGTRLILTAAEERHPAVPTIPAMPIALPGNPDSAARTEAARRSAAGSAEAIAILQATSGTTGTQSKLARQTHRMLTWQQAAPAHFRSWWPYAEAVKYRPRANYFSVRDFCETLETGGTQILSDARRPEEMEAEMIAHHVNALTAVPAMIALLVNRRAPPPPLALNFVRIGAAPIPERLVRLARERYQTAVLREYGSTEGGAMIGWPREGAPAESIGRPYPGVEARIINDDEEARTGTTGELVVRTPGLMRGYLDDVAATDEAIRDGWLWTGDLARQDAAGWIYLEGRQTLRINVGGFKVIPERVEQVLEAHPAIREAAVVAMPDARRGAAVRAVLVAYDAAPSDGELRRFCRARLADYEVPHVFEYRDALPRTELGKIRRQAL